MKNIVLITGGGKRLGSLIAKELSKESFHIVLHYNKSEKQALDTKDVIVKNCGKINLIRKEIYPRTIFNVWRIINQKIITIYF